MEKEITRKGLKKAQERFLKKCREVAEVKDFLDNILESMEDGVFTVDKERRITSFNKTASKITGLLPQEVIGKRCEEVFGNLICSEECALQKALRDRKPVYTHEIKILTKTNKEVPVSIVASPLRDKRGKVTGVIEVFRDLTPLRELEGQLAQSEKFALLGRLAAGLAHEINNPIAGILTYVRLILKRLDGVEEPLYKELNKYLLTIERETERIGRLIKSLLDFSRPLKPEIREVDMKEVLEQSLILLSEQLKMGRIAVHKDIAPSLPKVRGDFGQLQQVFMNIIINAAQAMLKGGELRIRILKDEKWVRAEFKDTGCGIPEENIPKLFDPFFTTKCGKKKCPGLGLGLSIVKKIIDTHYGFIEVKSKEGKGSTFIVKLPITYETHP